MAAIHATHSRDKIFDSFCENLQLVIDKLRDDETPPREKSDDFKLTDFWTKMETIFKAISFEATKMALCFSSPPPPNPEECQSLVSSVEMKTIALVSMYYGLPKECGTTLRKCTRNMVISVVDGVRELAQRIKRANYKSSEDQLQSTGTVWASCDSIESAPRNNRDAVLSELKSVAGLVRDAVEELEEAKQTDGSAIGGMDGLDAFLGNGQSQGDDQEQQVWSERDKAVLSPCLGLSKACKACVKKVTGAVKEKGRHKETEDAAQLDQVVELTDEISPNLDELVSCLYAPMRYAVVRANASLMSEVLHKLLDFVRTSHFVTPADSQWMDFLNHAIDHNVDQIKNITKEEAPT